LVSAGKYRFRLALAQSAVPDSGQRLAQGWTNGAEAMSLYVLDAVIRILEIRGHIPQQDNFHAASSGSSPGAASSVAVRIVAATLASLAFLALVLWAAVWCAIRLL
jgi:hypothetical protein